MYEEFVKRLRELADETLITTTFGNCRLPKLKSGLGKKQNE